ncbi:MAG: redoxin domain-containing protein [Ktedonobacteraceae bacterium]|nr:redoxin domain-containing protein [Ktedonobacteraceae bacterium]
MQPLLITCIVLLWIIVVFNLLLTLGIVRKLNNTPAARTASLTDNRLQQGEQAPDFTAETLDAQQVNLATYAGRTIVFLFISTHCNPCREAIPELLELAPMAAQADVEFVFVILAEVDKARAFAKQFQITLPVLVAPLPDNDFAEKYKSTSTPSYCLINGQGLVQFAGHPMLGGWKKLVAGWRKQKLSNIDVALLERR